MTERTIERGAQLHRLTVDVCDLCLAGIPYECHVPGCAFWIRDAPTGALHEFIQDHTDRKDPPCAADF